MNDKKIEAQDIAPLREFLRKHPEIQTLEIKKSALSKKALCELGKRISEGSCAIVLIELSDIEINQSNLITMLDKFSEGEKKIIVKISDQRIEEQSASIAMRYNGNPNLHLVFGDEAFSLPETESAPEHIAITEQTITSSYEAIDALGAHSKSTEIEKSRLQIHAEPIISDVQLMKCSKESDEIEILEDEANSQAQTLATMQDQHCAVIPRFILEEEEQILYDSVVRPETKHFNSPVNSDQSNTDDHHGASAAERNIADHQVIKHDDSFEYISDGEPETAIAGQDASQDDYVIL